MLYLLYAFELSMSHITFCRYFSKSIEAPPAPNTLRTLREGESVYGPIYMIPNFQDSPNHSSNSKTFSKNTKNTVRSSIVVGDACFWGLNTAVDTQTAIGNRSVSLTPLTQLALSR